VAFERRRADVHGTKPDLAVGDLLVPGREANVEAGRVMSHAAPRRPRPAHA
jgi:hypothetical protein